MAQLEQLVQFQAKYVMPTKPAQKSQQRRQSDILLRERQKGGGRRQSLNTDLVTVGKQKGGKDNSTLHN